MANLLAVIYVVATLVGLWWLRKEIKRISVEVFEEESTWMRSELDRLARRTDKLHDKDIELIKARHRKLFKDL